MPRAVEVGIDGKILPCPDCRATRHPRHRHMPMAVMVYRTPSPAELVLEPITCPSARTRATRSRSTVWRRSSRRCARTGSRRTSTISTNNTSTRIIPTKTPTTNKALTVPVVALSRPRASTRIPAPASVVGWVQVV